MADDRFSCCRSESIVPTRCDNVTFRALAISFSAFQNASSRLMLVLWPATTMERLMTRDFMRHPHCCSKSVTSDYKICPVPWPPEKNSGALQKSHTARHARGEHVRLRLVVWRRGRFYAPADRPPRARRHLLDEVTSSESVVG